MYPNIFTILKSEKDINFIKENGELGLEITTEIIDSMSNMPILGSFIKLCKIGFNTRDWYFINKLSIFLKQSQNVDEEKKIKFLNNLTENDNKRISSYLINLLYASEEEDKAQLMGMIYKARLLNKIDNDMMLRLCSIIYKSFLPDLKKLPLYKEQSNKDSIEANNFINLGLINNFVGGIWVDEPSWKLNDIGNQLYEILNQNKWFDENEK